MWSGLELSATRFNLEPTHFRENACRIKAKVGEKRGKLTRICVSTAGALHSRQIVEDDSLVSTHRAQDIRTGMHGETCNRTGMLRERSESMTGSIHLDAALAGGKEVPASVFGRQCARDGLAYAQLPLYCSILDVVNRSFTVQSSQRCVATRDVDRSGLCQSAIRGQHLKG